MIQEIASSIVILTWWVRSPNVLEPLFWVRRNVLLCDLGRGELTGRGREDTGAPSRHLSRTVHHIAAKGTYGTNYVT